MNEINQNLKDYYDRARLPADRINGILESCQPARQIHRWKSLAITGFSVAAAAVTALALVLAMPGVPDPAMAAGVDQKGAENRQPPAAKFQLVAVRIHADRCGRCQKLAPVFAKLQTEFKDQPVLFLTFDHSSKGSRKQAEMLSEFLGLKTVFKKHRYTGVIIVATPDGAVKEVVNSEASLASATEALTRNLSPG